MIAYDYYIQTDSTKSVRRYPKGAISGERWDRERKVWTAECADRRSCELTHDRKLTDEEALQLKE